MFVGYPHNHASDTFRMWDPRSRRVHITRDVIWLNKMFFPKLQSNYDTNIEYMQSNTEVVTYENDYKDSDDNNDTDTDNDKEISYNDTDNVSTQLNDNDVDNDTQNINTTTRFGRTSKIPKKYNDYLMMTQEPRYNETLLIGAGLGEGITHTLELKVKNYSKAISSDNKDKWIKAIDDEHKRMVHNNV
jgi:hypothetical protein